MLTWQPHPLGGPLLLACLLAVACHPGNLVQVQTHSQVGISARQAAASCRRRGLTVAYSTRSMFHNWSASGPHDMADNCRAAAICRQGGLTVACSTSST